MNAKEAAKPGVVGESAPPKLIRAIPADRVKNMAEAVGDLHQVVLEDHLDPIEVLGNRAYWQALPVKLFHVGARLELTNDAGSYLYELWVKRMNGAAATGIRHIEFHHRVVWDERSEEGMAPIEATGRWEVRFRGRHKLWRVYRPNGTEVETPFNDETGAVAYARQQEGNPKPR